ncbi:hypothetical protein Peur_046755 [Populus x canadensis]
MKAFNCMLIHFEKMVLEYLSKRCCENLPWVTKKIPSWSFSRSSSPIAWWLFTLDELIEGMISRSTSTQ